MQCHALHYWVLEEDKEPWWVYWDPWFSLIKQVFWTASFIWVEFLDPPGTNPEKQQTQRDWIGLNVKNRAVCSSLKVHSLLIPRTRLVHQTRDHKRQNHQETQWSQSQLGRRICQTEEILRWERLIQLDWPLGSDGRHSICERGL